MTTNIATTPSQSRRLLECGVDPETADMYYQVPITLSQKQRGEDVLLIKKSDATLYDTDTPAWSLSALLSNVLPKHLDDFPFTQWIEPFSDGEICEIEDNDERVLNGNVKLSYEETAWIVDYDWDGFTGILPNSDNPIEACVRAIELLYANGYKFNEI